MIEKIEVKRALAILAFDVYVDGFFLSRQPTAAEANHIGMGLSRKLGIPFTPYKRESKKRVTETTYKVPPLFPNFRPAKYRD